MSTFFTMQTKNEMCKFASNRTCQWMIWVVVAVMNDGGKSAGSYVITFCVNHFELSSLSLSAAFSLARKNYMKNCTPGIASKLVISSLVLLLLQWCWFHNHSSLDTLKKRAGSISIESQKSINLSNTISVYTTQYGQTHTHKLDIQHMRSVRIAILLMTPNTCVCVCGFAREIL